MEKVKITQVKSAIKRSSRQRATLEALGLRRLNQTVVHDLTPQVRGMVDTVKHLVKVEDGE